MKLTDILADATLKARFIKEGAALIDSEVSRKGGLTGFALKAGYRAALAVKPGVIETVLGMLLPHFTPAIEPFFAAGQAAGDVPGHFAKNAAAIADAMLKVTDMAAARAENPVLKRTYQSLRGIAMQHTTEAVPAVGKMLARFTS